MFLHMHFVQIARALIAWRQRLRTIYTVVIFGTPQFLRQLLIDLANNKESHREVQSVEVEYYSATTSSMAYYIVLKCNQTNDKVWLV